MRFRKPNDEGNEPTPQVLVVVALLPRLAILGWFLGLFG